MKLITWNIQWGCGVDGRVDLARIVAHARRMADFDVLCVQEVADNFADLEGNDDRDQFAELASLLPGFARFDCFGVDVPGIDGRRRRFGNAIFTRIPASSARRHALPWPPEPGKATMPRAAVEVTLAAPMGALRLTTSHLEYYSDAQRRAQAARLRHLHEESCQRAAAPPPHSSDANATFRPAPQTASAILCGDFNFPPTHPAHEEIQRPLAHGGPPYRDAWRIVHGYKPHAPTFCVHDARYSKEPYCCDFVFVSEDLARRVRSIEVDAATKDSDHQPVLLDLDDR
jgi:endonuclease/exonuclease/phosphatase family metal-dependent hydrolase